MEDLSEKAFIVIIETRIFYRGYIVYYVSSKIIVSTVDPTRMLSLLALR